MEDLTGKQFGPYQIVAALGEGGMAAVYKAYQPAMERFVAIKVLPRQYAQDPDFVARFKREAKLLAQLQHPDILPVFDFGEADGYTYLVMPLLQSGSLTSWLKGQPLAWPLIHQIITQLGEALHYAHTHGLIHRDVKPSNVLLDESGNCLLSDFGLARMTESASKITNTGAILGTPAYMAPEQGSGQNIDARSDLYALGVILYELITGRVPYRAETPVAVIFKHIQDPLPSAREYNPNIPEAVERVLLKSLAKRPEDRFQTGADFVRALQAALPNTAPTATDIELPKSFETMMASTLPPQTNGRRKAPAWVWLVATFVGTICILGGIGLAVGAFLTGNLPMPNAAGPTATASLAIAAVQPSPTRLPATATASPSPAPTPTPTATLGIGSIRRAGPDGMEQVFVPAGEFTLGLSETERQLLISLCPTCNPASLENAVPQRRVYLDAYWIDRTEITNAQFATFVAATGFVTIAEQKQNSYVYDAITKESNYLPLANWRTPKGEGSSIVGQDNFAVTQMSWVDADAYCRWAGRRLPTEAEWEKAARGPQNYLFPWGNTPPTFEALNYDLSHNGPVAVGSYPSGVSAYGALDMAGNVWEWTSDYYAKTYYQEAPASNPRGPATGEGYTFRGGSWFSNGLGKIFLVTAVGRLWNKPEIRSDVLGFRCVSPTTETTASAASSVPTAIVRVSATAPANCQTVTGVFGELWLNVKDKLGCNTTEIVRGLVAEENFQGGRMFWRQPFDVGQIVVAFNSGTWKIYQPGSFVEGSPEFSCVDANTLAQSPPTPKRGFGKAWCEIPEIRQKLGNAVDEERGYEGTLQIFERGFILRNEFGATYIFFADGTWVRR